ncbi:MAG TPA: type II secretion system F family protein, partial [Thermomicrobiales bacterium]|nr:type II secretion system F family protein [Thermomicrobiales bacterium]
RRRLDEHEVQVARNEARRLERREVLKEQNYTSIAALNSILARLRTAHTAAVELARADVPLTVPQYLLARPLFAAIAAAIAVRLTGISYVAIPVFLVGLMAPRLGLKIKARRRKAAFEGQLAEAIDLIVGGLRAGYGFLQALEAASKELDDPMAVELSRVIEQVNVGTKLADALQELSERVDSYDLSMFVTAVNVQRSVGGNLAEVLDNIASTVRERRRVRGEVKAMTTSARASSYVLGLFPVGLMLFFTTTDDRYREVMLNSTLGRIMLAFAAIWSFIGFLAANAVSKVEY